MNVITRAAVALALSGGAALAAEQTAVFEVQNVYCQACPPVVKSIFGGVPGVSKVSITDTVPTAVATVQFDDSKTSAAALAEATTKAGFPSKLKR